MSLSLLFLQLAAAATPPLGIPADWVDAWSRGTLFYSPTTPRDKWDLHGEGVLRSQKIDAFFLSLPWMHALVVLCIQF